MHGEDAMRLEIRNRIATEIRLTPQMILRMQVLAQPNVELRADIVAAVTANPALEEDADQDGDPETDGAPADADPATAPDEGPSDDERLLDHLDGGFRGNLTMVALEREVDEEGSNAVDRIASSSKGLAEHLRQQLREETDDEQALSIGEWIIGNLDTDGFLREDVSAIAEGLGVSPDVAATVLRRIQGLDPVGAGARDARDCLLIQARSRYPDRPHLARLIEGHLPDVKERRYAVIARALSVAVDAVREEEKALLTLNPKPARGFGRDAATCIMPDVRIFKVGGDLLVRVDDDGLPRLRVSLEFRRILKNPRGVAPEDVAFARARVAAAKWFLQCIYERQRTILKVTEAIVARQRDFFEYGRQALRPMILRDVAEDIAMCESTVSRVTSRKYADTPQGLVELRSFFGGGFRGTNGTEVGSEAAKAMIRRIVAVEDPARPLSDQQILSRLRSEHGVVIARRTVAKYRDGLGIADSSARRR